MSDKLRINHADTGQGLRWFIRRGATTWFNRGFKTKASADEWIKSHGQDLDWRAGFMFALRGDPRNVLIVDKNGRSPKV